MNNSNKKILVNSVMLYLRLGITTLCALATTRIALKALGIDDFGLFALIGNIIAFVSIFNTIMLSTSNRFIAIAIGRGDNEEVRRQFCVNVSLHALIAIITLLIALPLGYVYIFHFLNFEGSLTTAFIVYVLSVVGASCSFLGVPYNGLLIAKEEFGVFCTVDVVVQIVKLLFTWGLLYATCNKLLAYASMQCVLTIAPALCYIVYCNRRHSSLVRLNRVHDREAYREVMSFSGWVAYGAFATVGKEQGAAILVNSFFNTAMNAALGIANTVHTFLMLFVHNVSQPMVPQISKSYAQGDMKRCTELLVMSTKYTYLVMLLIAGPFLVGCESILRLWLGHVPPYAVHFTFLLMIDALVTALNSGISTLIFASGRIRLYQISINTLRLGAIAAAYVVLRNGGSPYSLFYAYIVFSLFIFFTTQWVLQRTLNGIDFSLWRRSYLPSLSVTALFLVALLLPKSTLHPLAVIILSTVYLVLLITLFGLSHHERQELKRLILARIRQS